MNNFTKLARENGVLDQCPSKTSSLAVVLKRIRLPEADGGSVNVTQSGFNFAVNFQLEQTQRRLRNLKLQVDRLRCA